MCQNVSLTLSSSKIRAFSRILAVSAHVVVSLLWLTILICTVSTFSFFVCILYIMPHGLFLLSRVTNSFLLCCLAFRIAVVYLRLVWRKCSKTRFRAALSPVLCVLCLALIILFLNSVRCLFYHGTDSLNVFFLGIVLFPASSIAFTMFSENNCASVSFLTFRNSA